MTGRCSRSGGMYLNCLTQDKGAERIEAALEKRLSRPASVWSLWDSEGLTS